MLKNKQKVEVDWKQQLASASREGALILGSLASVFLILSLISYVPDDPGWRHSGFAMSIQNLGGEMGALLADVLFSFVGYMAFLLAAIPIIQLIRRMIGPVIMHSWLGISWRFFGLLLLLFSGAAITHLYESGDALPFGVGGIVGEAIAEYLSTHFGHIGACMGAWGAFLFGLTVFGDISWLATLDRLGGLVLKISRYLGRRFSGAFTNRRENKVLDGKPEVKRKLKIDPDFDLLEASTRLSEEEVKSAPRLIHSIRSAHTEQSADGRDVGREPEPQGAVGKAKKTTNTSAETSVDGKKIKIQPFEKKSKGVSTIQGKMFSGDELPSIDLLVRQEGVTESGYSPEKLESMSRLLEQKLADFGVKIEVVAVNPGPVITRFEIQPAPGVKASKITNLAKDIARSLAMVSVRVVEVIPGKSVMGLEIPNENRAMVYLGDVLASSEYQASKSPLSLALGHDIAGDPVTADLAKMPHLLVAGTTGSGKSVGVNSMLISMLYKSSPDDVRMIMVDPKMLELSVYDGIPHLLTPVITDMKEAANGLRWCVGEMERRYKLMAALGVRNISGYNKKVLDARKAGEPILDPLWKPEESFEPTAPELQKLPYIVVVIDEFADMMMIVGKKVEELIARIAQKARAAGIHLILATQRPSVDIITGLIKANVPTRIAFQVSSRIDSRTILDQGGAEQLLGHGDMLYLPPGTSVPIRVHGAFIDDDEVHAVVADWKSRGEPEFIESITDGSDGTIIPGMPSESDDGEADALFDEAVAFVTETRKVSISSVQRKLRIGYNRAARLVETMEQAGVVSTPASNGSREVLAAPPVQS